MAEFKVDQILIDKMTNEWCSISVIYSHEETSIYINGQLRYTNSLVDLQDEVK